MLIFPTVFHSTPYPFDIMFLFNKLCCIVINELTPGAHLFIH
jgi:hypothetical protein